MLYRRIEGSDLETTPVQFVAVHPFRWGKVDEPSCGFVEAGTPNATCECERHPCEIIEEVDDAGVKSWRLGTRCSECLAGDAAAADPVPTEE